MSGKSSDNSELPNVCLVLPSPSPRVPEAFSIRVSDLLQLFKPSSNAIYVITGHIMQSRLSDNEKQDVFFTGNASCLVSGSPFFSMVFGELKTYFQVNLALLKLPKSVKIIFWRGRPSTYFIPLILSKILGKKAILFVEGRGFELVSEFYTGPFGIGGRILSQIYRLIEVLSYSIADVITVNVPSLLDKPLGARYHKKVFSLPISDRYIHSNFTISKPVEHRKTLIGYIGRLSQEKGVLNLVHAIPSICNKVQDAEFLICGDGPLLQYIQNELSEMIETDRVQMVGWVSYDELPHYLNEMKLLILPSYYEGLPHTMLEAMACGTPVLATAVGAIPDVITDRETGFIIEDNSPEHIEANTLRALSWTKLKELSWNARSFAEVNYNYEVLAQKYKMLLTQIAEK